MDLLEGRKFSPATFGRVCVLGLGATGASVAKFFLSQMPQRVESLHVYAGKKTKFSMSTADKLLKGGASVSFDDEAIVDNYDLCVVSPGISNLSQLYTTACDCCEEVISEVELAWRESSAQSCWIAVTGTNGKTTTTSLIASVLKSAGKRAVAVGNIGFVALEAVVADHAKSAYEHTEYFVVEVSSYQSASCIKFAPQVGVLLNITPDHIAWHGSFEAYADAKMHMFENCHTAVVNTQNKDVAKRIDKLEENDSVCEIIEIGDVGDDIEVDFRGQIHNICKTQELKILGKHNFVNAQAASAACLRVGLSDSQIKNGLIEFSPLEHRLEPCGIIAGARFFNDSKATNVDAVLVALESFENGKAIFLMGGRDKGTDLTELVDKSIAKLKGVVCFGECKDRFYEAFVRGLDKNPSPNFVLKMAENLESAFSTACEIASFGDYIVLSPACASFDEFSCFEERGDTFKTLVESRKQI